MHAGDYITNLAASGRHDFLSREAQSALGVSADAAKLALNRPPEYRSLGCLPADQFTPLLMNRLGLSNYAGLLSAAEYHGAAHQRPQEFQVMLAKNRRPIECGAVRVAFFARKRIAEVPVQRLNTPRGVVLVSTPEATAVDLVGYQHRAGGLDQVATILAELAGTDRSRKARGGRENGARSVGATTRLSVGACRRRACGRAVAGLCGGERKTSHAASPHGAGRGLPP